MCIRDSLYRARVRGERDGRGQRQAPARRRARRREGRAFQTRTPWGEKRTLNFKKVELNGFKSFADKTEIKFDNGVTCICLLYTSFACESIIKK